MVRPLRARLGRLLGGGEEEAGAAVEAALKVEARPQRVSRRSTSSRSTSSCCDSPNSPDRIGSGAEEDWEQHDRPAEAVSRAGDGQGLDGLPHERVRAASEPAAVRRPARPGRAARPDCARHLRSAIADRGAEPRLPAAGRSSPMRSTRSISTVGGRRVRRHRRPVRLRQEHAAQDRGRAAGTDRRARSASTGARSSGR